MSLIECPHCGGKISDKASICPHCNYSLLEEQRQQEISKEYTRLSVSEQKALREEYNRINSELLRRENQHIMISRIYRIIWFLTWLSFAGFFIGFFFYNKNKCSESILIAFATMFIVLFVVVYILYALLHVANRRRLREVKNFKDWLKESKQMTYNIILNNRDKKIFESF